MTSSTVTDNRRFTELPVRDETAALETSAAPLEQLGVELTPYTPREDKKPDVRFDLSPFARQHGEFLIRHARKSQDEAWLREFKKLLGGMAPEATLIRFANADVATFRRDAQLSLSQLAKEQPDIIARYTRRKTVEVFDKEAFLAEMPEMYAAYRGRSYRLIKNPALSDGLFVPTQQS